MESSIFGFIWKYSKRQQLVILALSVVLLPLNYYSYDIPKQIVNRALGTDENPSFFGHDMDRLQLLMVLCGLFLGVVLISGALKYVVNVYAGVVAERMLRRLRFQLYSQLLRFPLPHLRRVSQGELVQMINAETEALGGFVGEAVSTPGLQAGTLLTSLFFMFVQDWKLGLAAVALYPLQIYLIPKLQRQVNLLGKERVRQVRRNAEKISEVAAGARDIRANDATVYERARFSEQLGAVFWIRFDIYKKKFLIKFINNFISQLGPFFFYAIGGYLVLQGQMTIGALTAVVGAQKDITSPWRELLTYYQSLYDVKIKYEQVVAQFTPPGVKDERLQLDEPEPLPSLDRRAAGQQSVRCSATAASMSWTGSRSGSSFPATSRSPVLRVAARRNSPWCWPACSSPRAAESPSVTSTSRCSRRPCWVGGSAMSAIRP